MHIRIATNLDRDAIHDVHLTAFAREERGIVSRLAANLLAEETTPPTISLVADVDGVIAGHVAFSPVTIDGNEKFHGYILAPLGIKPDYQQRGIGSKLVEHGIQQLSAVKADMLFVYGDPAYYNKFGFSAGAAENYSPPYKLQYPFGWQGLALNASNTEKSPVRIACVTSLCDPALW